jgi:hypothetical protein
VQKKEVVMKRLNEEFSCEHCRLSITELKVIAEKDGKSEMFTTFGGRNWMNIYEVNSSENFIIMKRKSQKLTKKLSITALIHVHDLVHHGKINLDPHEIDNLKINGKRETWRWGNYIAALLKHLGCRKIVIE